MACRAALAAASAIAALQCCSSSAAPVSAPRTSFSSSLCGPLSLRRSLRDGAPGVSARRSGSVRSNPLLIKAAASEDVNTDIAKQAEEVFNDLKAKWDGIENKTSVAIYGSGALVTVWLSSTIVGAINSVPLLPKLLELIGLVYTGWFVYRYLLFKSSRKELAAEIEALKGKITGATDDISS